MIMKKLLFIAALLISVVACKEKKKQEQRDVPATQTEEVGKISFEMTPKSDSEVKGTVTFTEENGEVMMMAYLSGLTPGVHAIHLHETADCSSEDGTSTGGHWNPTFEPHGAWGVTEGFHRGDIGNFTADESGNANVHFMTDLWTIGGEDMTRNILGKAVIVHQGEDDLTSQPSGAAGARVSCTGIIE
jgi:Cu-Zn family superoxide dismutase